MGRNASATTGTALAGRQRVLDSIPRRKDIPVDGMERTVRLSALAGVPTPNFVPGREESILAGRRAGATMPPIKIGVSPSGVTFIDDGNHRLRVARREGDRTIRVRFVRHND